MIFELNLVRDFSDFIPFTLRYSIAFGKHNFTMLKSLDRQPQVTVIFLVFKLVFLPSFNPRLTFFFCQKLETTIYFMKWFRVSSTTSNNFFLEFNRQEEIPLYWEKNYQLHWSENAWWYFLSISGLKYHAILTLIRWCYEKEGGTASCFPDCFGICKARYTVFETL